jgi:hypothetical protein
LTSRFIAELGKIDEQQNKSDESTSSSTSNEKGSAPQVPSAPGQVSYAQVAAEAPSQGTASSAIVNDRSGLSERKSASQGRSTASSQSGPGQESYAEAAAEEPDPNDSVVREDKVGITETR